MAFDVTLTTQLGIGLRMQFVVIARNRTESFAKEEFDELRPEERRVVRTLHEQGFIRNAWLCDDGRAILLMESSDKLKIVAALGTLPFSQRGMLDCQVIAVRQFEGFESNS